MSSGTTLAQWARAKAWRAIAAIALVITVLIIAWRLGVWGACSIYGHQTERETRYAAFVGCMVKIDGKWYPRNELRIAQ